MSFYLFIGDSTRLPSLDIFVFEHGDKWVAIGGNYQALLESPRYARFVHPATLPLGLGPRWFVIPWVWRMYGAMGPIAPDDPVALFFWIPDLVELVYEGGQSMVEAVRGRDMMNRALAFDEICKKLRSSAPTALFRRDDVPITPVSFDFARIMERDRPGRIVDMVREFQKAALDRVAMVAWWTLNFKGWEAELSEQQIEMIRSCAFESRPKCGCLLNLTVDHPYVNFEKWIQHGVPIYYVFTEAMHLDKRFARVRPEVVQEYWDRCKDSAPGSNAENVMHTLYEADRPSILEYDDFFQQVNMRDLLQDTPALPYDPGAMYHMQAFQNWKPYSCRSPAFAQRLLIAYETVVRPERPFDVRVVRWAPRAPWKEERGLRGYTIHRGNEEHPATLQFTGRSFDKESGWIENDVFVLRELLKPAYAPEYGEIYTMEGRKIRDPLPGPEGLRVYERDLVARALLEGENRPSEYVAFHDWEVGWDEDFVLSSGGVTTSSGTTSQQGGNEDLEMGSESDDESSHHRSSESEFVTASTGGLTLQQRLSDPGTGRPLEEDGPESGGLLARLSDAPPPSGRPRTREANSAPPPRRGLLERLSEPGDPAQAAPPFRGRRDYAARAASSSSFSATISSRSTDDRSASPVRVARLADPAEIVDKIYSPSSSRWEELEAEFWGQLMALGRYLVEPRGSRAPDPKRRPRLSWATEFLERGYLEIHEFEDRIRVFLYIYIHHSLRTPIDVLDYILEKGIKVTFWMPRDPIPSPVEAGTNIEPSDNESLTLAGKRGLQAFRAWQSALASPLWAKTHFTAFIQQGKTINFVTRHYAQTILNYAATGVSWESRVHTRNVRRLPTKLGGIFVVKDEVGPDEIGVAEGRVDRAEDDQNPHYVVPPAATFTSPVYWNLGTGEWSRAEEEFMQEVIQRWRTGNGLLQTQGQWNKFARTWSHGYLKRHPQAARDERFPSTGDCTRWCELIEEAFSISLEYRKILELTVKPKLRYLRRFR